MARMQSEASAATLSVLDRLIDIEPRDSYELPLTRAQSVRAIKSAVRRDLEWLLNARRVAVDPPPGMKEINRSLYMFGLPDLASFSMGSMKDRTRLLRTLQNAIRVFEPRLANVRIVSLDGNEIKRQTMAFRIEGTLLMDPSPEQVSFDTVLEVARAEYVIKGEPDAG